VLFGDDGVNRTIRLAYSTIDALIGIDDVDITFGDAINRTIRFAGTASDAGIQNFSWHRQPSLFDKDLTSTFYSTRKQRICK